MVTRRTGRRAVLAVLVLLAAVTVALSHRRVAEGDYGRLFDKQMPVAPAPVVTKTIPVVTEGTTAATTVQDPMLAAPAATTESAAPPPVAPPVSVVTGDSGSITILRSNGEKPRLLTGGIFKPQP